MRRTDVADLEEVLKEFGGHYSGHYSYATYPETRRIAISLIPGHKPEFRDFSSFVDWAADRNIIVEFLSNGARGPRSGPAKKPMRPSR